MPVHDMVDVPGGVFAQGTPEHVLDALDRASQPFPRLWFQDETPVHEVAVAPFRIDRHPVTVADFAAFVRATGHVTEPEQCGYGLVYGADGWAEVAGACWRRPSGPDAPAPTDDALPVVQVAWTDAAAYAAWAGKRLPEETEWELAARGWDFRYWPWGDDWSDRRANTTEHWVSGIAGYADWQGWWRDRCGRLGVVPLATPVGRFAAGASPFGCHDMAGNVYEWTASVSQPYAQDAVCDPAVAAAMGRYRVIRGGSWMNLRYQVRCTERMHGDPSGWATFVHGFRCAQDWEGARTWCEW